MNDSEELLNESDIEELLEISNAGNNIKEEFEKKYKKIVERPDKREILKLIKKDLVNKYYDVSLLELEILSNNIYYYACLIVSNVSKTDIVNFISFENIHYYKKITNVELKKFNSEINLRYIKYLISKYVELMKNN